MNARARLPSRRIVFADAMLAPLRGRLVEALDVTGLVPAGDRCAVLGETAFLAGTWPEAPEGARRVVVLSGPTPATARRLPASLVLLPPDLVPQGRASSPLGLAEALAREFGNEPAGNVPDVAGVWQEHGLSCTATGEPERPTPSGAVLEALLRGEDVSRDDGSTWAALATACEGAGVDLKRCLNALLARCAVWFSPYTGEIIPAQEALDIFRIIQTHWQENAAPAHCYGAQYWNHPSIRATFSGRGGPASFHETWEETYQAARASKGRILSWAGRTEPAFEDDCAREGIPLARIEDGFLRSVGLGAGLARGAMLAVDDLGIYYDPSRPSRLETLLNTRDLSDAEISRGESLIALIREARVSKYNFGKARSFTFPEGRRLVLVPGQVADDAAIRKSRSDTIDCANTPNVNLDLLRLARQRHPDAYLIFKPHPDVETGLRKGRLTREEVLAHADAIAEDANIIDLIEAVDALETFSSLSGFEALMRGKNVAVHGAPFYAGWGLCEDLTVIEGRGRERSLAELVYLALVVYARTIDPVTLLPCAPEFLVRRLSEQRCDRKHLLVTAVKRHASWLGRKLGL